MGTTRTLNSHWSGTGRSGSENFLHIEGTGPGNYLWRWTEEYIYAYQPKFSENSSAEWKAPFQITRSYIRVPFTYASSLLSENQEQGKAYLKINSLVKTPLHEFMAVEIHVCILSGNALEFLSVLKLQEKSAALPFILFCICSSQWPYISSRLVILVS